MQVKLNGEPTEATLTIKRPEGQIGTEYLYVDGQQVARVTHSRSDDVPVILAIDEDTLFEVEPAAFYSIDGMHRDWQPGSQEGVV